MSTAGENQTLTAYRVEPLSLELGKVTTKEFMYAAPIEDDMLLGVDFMRRYTPAIDFKNRTMSIHNEVVPIRQREVRKPQCRSVSLLKDITLHLNTIINPQYQGELGEDGLFVIEIEEQLSVLGPRVVIEGNKYLLVCLVNLSDQEVKLKKDTQIAKAYPISEGETEGTGGEYLEDRTCQGDAVVGKLPESKSIMFLEACKGLNKEQQNLVEQLLMTHAGVFAEDDLDLGTFTAVKHVIDTGEASPIKHKLRRKPLHFVKKEEEHLNKMLAAGVIQPSVSEWAAAPVLIRKRDGSVRWCVDYRALNKITKKKMSFHCF